MSNKTFSRFKITNEIRTILINNPELNELIGSKIYPIIAPVGTIGDVILYYRDQSYNEYTNMGVVAENCNIFIVAESKEYETGQDIAELIDDSLEGKHLVNGNEYFECRLIDSTEDYEDKKFLQILLYQIK